MNEEEEEEKRGPNMAIIMVAVLSWACEMTSISNNMENDEKKFLYWLKLTSYLR